MTRIALTSTGRLSRALALGWARSGNDLYIGSRTPEKAQRLADRIAKNALGGSIGSAVAFADVVVLSVPWFALEDTLRHAGSLDGKILIDCSNPVAGGGRSLLVGHSDSGAEQLARRVPTATVVKALNTVSARMIARCSSGPTSPPPVTALLCGDRAQANRVVCELLVDLGLRPLDVGELVQARYLEPLAMLLRDVDEGTPNLALRLVVEFDE